mmetsp:Transcript_1806/g.4217  ORF Transcript_1806/g.4217 Transcript_1806/m.4217 type:complete len:532 (-) Transcript_1806:125-1720(-)
MVSRCRRVLSSQAPASQSGAAFNMGRLSLAREVARLNPSGGPSIPLIAQKSVLRTSAADLLNSARFDNFLGMVILLNACSIGAQTDYMARNVTGRVPFKFQVVEWIFLAFFTGELAIRVYVHRCRFFWSKAGFNVLAWNWFDLLLVVAQVSEEVLVRVARDSTLESSQFRLMAFLRILRLVRVLRVMRVLRLIGELRAIVSSIVGSMKSLLWTVLLLLLVIYMVGVYFTQSVTEHMVIQAERNQGYSPELKTLSIYFGSLGRTLLSLYQAMSGGIDWDSLADPLITEIGFMMGVGFAAYIAFSLLALMNVVTGVFVQTALQSARDEEDAFLTDQIIKIFHVSSVDEEQHISWSEVELALTNPDTALEWKAIDLPVSEARFLYDLLDLDDSENVQFEEFLSGCLRMRGNAKASDLLTVMQEQRKLAKNLKGFAADVMDQLGCIESTLQPLESLGFKKLSDMISRLTALVDPMSNRLRGESDALREVRRELQAIKHGQAQLQATLDSVPVLNIRAPKGEAPAVGSHGLDIEVF